MGKYGVVDIGSNTVRLEVYDVNDHFVQLFFKKKEFLGLANYVDKKILSNEGIRRTIDVLKDYIAISDLLRVEDLFIFATAAIRNAKNSKEVIDTIERETGHKIDLISGEREAELGFKLVSNRFGLDTAVNLDIGGGSTEISAYDSGELVISKSLPDGSLSLYREFVSGILPKPDEVKAIKEKVRTYIRTEEISDQPRKKVYGVGGTIRMVNRLVAAYYEEDTGDVINTKKLYKIYKKLLDNDMTLVKLILKIAPERIHTAIPGLIILTELCSHLSVKAILVSDSGVREGYLLSKIEGE
ncbi:MAG: hypothetical protein Q4E50_01545 [Tissierellia bacterium]|nr:hypothetical protein [Tissierellia bacterium]